MEPEPSLLLRRPCCRPSHAHGRARCRVRGGRGALPPRARRLRWSSVARARGGGPSRRRATDRPRRRRRVDVSRASAPARAAARGGLRGRLLAIQAGWRQARAGRASLVRKRRWVFHGSQAAPSPSTPDEARRGASAPTLGAVANAAPRAAPPHHHCRHMKGRCRRSPRAVRTSMPACAVSTLSIDCASALTKSTRRSADRRDTRRNERPHLQRRITLRRASTAANARLRPAVAATQRQPPVLAAWRRPKCQAGRLPRCPERRATSRWPPLQPECGSSPRRYDGAA